MPTNPSSQPIQSSANPANSAVVPPGNPFTPGIVVSPERFFGRQQERSEILGDLKAC